MGSLLKVYSLNINLRFIHFCPLLQGGWCRIWATHATCCKRLICNNGTVLHIEWQYIHSSYVGELKYRLNTSKLQAILDQLAYTLDETFSSFDPSAKCGVMFLIEVPRYLEVVCNSVLFPVCRWSQLTDVKGLPTT